jgi:hypothetical protein
MLRVQTIFAGTSAVVALIAGLIAIGCGGSSGSNPAPNPVPGAVNNYNNATTQAAATAAIAEINSAIGSSGTGVFSQYEMSAAFTSGVASIALLDRQSGNPLTVASVLATWRALPETRISVATDTLLASLNPAISEAKANPSNPRSNLLIALDLIHRDINAGQSQVTASSRLDPIMGRLLVIFIFDRFGLATPAPQGTRDACQDCINNHNAACRATYDSQVAATEAQRALHHDMVDDAPGLTAAERQSFLNQVDSDANAENFEHSKELQSCQSGASAACAQACHDQGN